LGEYSVGLHSFFKNDDNPIQGSCISQYRDNYHVPFLHEYFERVIELTRDFVVTHGKEEEHTWHTESQHMYDDNTFSFVTDRYGLTREDLSAFKTLLQGVVSLPVVIDWPLMFRCV